MADPDDSTRFICTSDQACPEMGFLKRLTNADVAPLNLNYLFDNIRNYTLATTVMIAGIWLFARGGNVFGTPYINWIFGAHVTLCGLILIGINFAHSVRTITKTPGARLPAYIVFLTLFIGSLELVWVALWNFLA